MKKLIWVTVFILAVWAQACYGQQAQKDNEKLILPVSLDTAKAKVSFFVFESKYYQCAICKKEFKVGHVMLFLINEKDKDGNVIAQPIHQHCLRLPR